MPTDYLDPARTTVGGVGRTLTLYSLIETAKANGIEPHRCLLNVIDRVP